MIPAGSRSTVLLFLTGVMDYGRNIGSWAPAEVDKLVRKGDPVLVPMEVYKEWYDKLSLKIRDGNGEQMGETRRV